MSPVAKRGIEDRERRAELLPAGLLPLIDDAFVRSCDLLEEFVQRLVVEIVRRTGLDAAASSAGSAAELAARAGMQGERAALVITWMFELLVAGGVAAHDEEEPDTVRYRIAADLTLDAAEEIEARQREHDPDCLPAYELARRAADAYPDFLAGRRRGEELLFAGDGRDLWLRYFSGDNPLYAINNEIGALAVCEWVTETRGEWLELGGGGASGSLALLSRLAGSGRLQELEGYRFTEMVPKLLAYGGAALRRRFEGAVPLHLGRLDMDRGFAEQGVAPESLGVVYAVNTVHVARDLAFTLAEIRRALAPGGWVVLSEGLRPFAGRPVYTELAFLLLDAYRAPHLDPRIRPSPGFMTPEQWQTALAASEFEDLRFLPDVRRLREVYPSFVVGAIGARRRF